MKKKSKYKPKGIRLDAVNWVLTGMKPISQVGDALITLKAKNHSAFTEITQGRGNYDQVDILIASMNMCEAYARNGKGKDWLPEIMQAQDALFTMGKRGLTKGRFLFTGEEMQAMNLGMEIHDAQLDQSTVKEMEDMMDYVMKQIRQKKARAI